MTDQEQPSGKYKKTITVHGKNGDYNQVREVGSDKNPLTSKHHGLDTMFKEPHLQDQYESHLQKLIPHEGGYYHIHEKNHVSQGRTSFGSGKHIGATKYDLHPYEKAYKEHLDKQNKIDHSGKQKELETALYNDNWYGLTQTHRTQAYPILKERETKPVENIHKEAGTPKGKELIKKDNEAKDLQQEKFRQNQEHSWNTRAKLTTEKILDYDYKTSTIKDLTRLVKLELSHLGVIKQDAKVILITRNGTKRERTWGQLRTWLYSENQIPFNSGQPLPFTSMEVDLGDNPYKK